MKITELCARQGSESIFICDYSPLKSGRAASIEPAQDLDADIFCVAYLPGKAVRTNSAALAQAIKAGTGREAIFNLGTRDMNKLALQSLLLGAQMMGLENVLVLQGDPFTAKQLAQAKDVSDFTPTGLIRSIRAMNAGRDYKGLKLQDPTDFCIGATADLTRGIQAEARLTAKKIAAGADYILTQPVFEANTIRQFEEAYSQAAGESLYRPVFWGLQVFSPQGFIFSSVPEQVRSDLEKGRDGLDIALETLEMLQQAGINRIYLVPPILKGGRRDYQAAGGLLAAAKETK